MRETTHHTLTPLDAQMSKMSPEQRVAMASLNAEAKKRLDEERTWDAYVAIEKLKEPEMERKTQTETTPPIIERELEAKCLPDPLEPAPTEVPAGIARAHEQGGPTSPFACELCNGTGAIATDNMDAQYDCPECDGSGTDTTKLATLRRMVARPLYEESVDLGITHSIRYTQETLATEFRRIFNEEIMALRDAGQKEYAHDDSSPFANFERGAKDTGIDRKQILWIYAMKHKDGIAGFLQGHTSQREDVRGRIGDLIVYLLLMYAMINEEVGSLPGAGLGDLK